MKTRAQLFTSCMVDLFRPRAAIAAVRVLERRDIQVEVPEKQTCCGQFAFNAGHHREAAAMGRQFVRAFETGAADGPESEPPRDRSLGVLRRHGKGRDAASPRA